MMGSDSNEGVIPRAVQHIFAAIEESKHMQFLIRVSYMEVYNETVIDLLQGKVVKSLNIVGCLIRERHFKTGTFFGLSFHFSENASYVWADSTVFQYFIGAHASLLSSLGVD